MGLLAQDFAEDPRQPRHAQVRHAGAGSAALLPITRQVVDGFAGDLMHATTGHGPSPRPPSPWPGSRYEVRHRWELDGVRTLPEAAEALRRIAAELAAAHAAGWSLREPMRSGRLLAARLSRRQRGQAPAPPPPLRAGVAPAVRWRVRLVDEPPVPGDPSLRLKDLMQSPVLAAGDGLRQISGPPVTAGMLAELRRQVSPHDLGDRCWGLASARVGPSVDLVAEGSALRVHAVCDGALVRTAEALAFQHGANGAASLLDAAAAYERLAQAAEAMAAAGGRLTSVEDGHLHISYGSGHLA